MHFLQKKNIFTFIIYSFLICSLAIKKFHASSLCSFLRMLQKTALIKQWSTIQKNFLLEF